METMRIDQFEEAVWERERIRIVVRADSRSLVRKYDYIRAARNRRRGRSREFITPISTVLLRVHRYLPTGTEVVVLNGKGRRVSSNVSLEVVRASYRTDSSPKVDTIQYYQT